MTEAASPLSIEAVVPRLLARSVEVARRLSPDTEWRLDADDPASLSLDPDEVARFIAPSVLCIAQHAAKAKFRLDIEAWIEEPTPESPFGLHVRLPEPPPDPHRVLPPVTWVFDHVVQPHCDDLRQVFLAAAKVVPRERIAPAIRPLIESTPVEATILPDVGAPLPEHHPAQPAEMAPANASQLLPTASQPAQP